jgi:hypothetical protein
MPFGPEIYRNRLMTKICEAIEVHLPDDGKWDAAGDRETGRRDL